LIGPDDIRILVYSGTVTRNNEVTIANQRNPRELGFHNPRPRVGERVEVVNPEQPPLHQELGYEVSRVLDDVGDEDDGHAEGGVEVLEAQAECTEETLHGEISEIGDDVERPEGSC